MATMRIPETPSVPMDVGDPLDIYYDEDGSVTHDDRLGRFDRPLYAGPVVKGYHDHHKAKHTGDVTINFVPKKGEDLFSMHVIHIGTRRDGDEKLPELENLDDIGKKTGAILGQFLETLKSNAGVTAADPKRFFFPNGISSISVAVTVGTISVQVSASGGM